jgi:hypothetical protein
MDDTKIYHKLAADCLERASATPDPDAAAGLIRLGQHWLRKASRLENMPTEQTLVAVNRDPEAEAAVDAGDDVESAMREVVRARQGRKKKRSRARAE